MPKAKHYRSVYGAIRRALAGSIKFTRIVRNVAVMCGTVSVAIAILAPFGHAKIITMAYQNPDLCLLWMTAA